MIETPTVNRPDLPLVTWVGEQLTTIMPKIATEFLDYERTKDAKRKLNAKLSLLYQNEKN